MLRGRREPMSSTMIRTNPTAAATSTQVSIRLEFRPPDGLAGPLHDPDRTGNCLYGFLGLRPSRLVLDRILLGKESSQLLDTGAYRFRPATNLFQQVDRTPMVRVGRSATRESHGHRVGCADGGVDGIQHGGVVAGALKG